MSRYIDDIANMVDISYAWFSCSSHTCLRCVVFHRGTFTGIETFRDVQDSTLTYESASRTRLLYFDMPSVCIHPGGRSPGTRVNRDIDMTWIMTAGLTSASLRESIQPWPCDTRLSLAVRFTAITPTVTELRMLPAHGGAN